MNTQSTFSSDMATYIAKKTLMLALKVLVLYGLCDKPQQPHNHGSTFQYTRYERIDLPQTELTEGTTPDSGSMSISTVQAVMDQWGSYLTLTDVAIDTVMHPVLQKAINLNSLQAAETVDREIVKVLQSGTNVFYPNAISARGSLTTSDKMSSAFAGKIVSYLRSDGAMPYDGDLYVGVVDPFVEDDMTNDATFVTASSYGAIKKLFVNEIGTWKGVRWVRSNSIPVLRLLTGASGASSATAGSLANSTTYNFKVAVVDKKTGHETYISATFNGVTGMSEESLDITIPALPAAATAGSLFRLYAGTNGGTLYLKANNIAASATYNVGTIPTSGDVAQASAPSGVPVHFTYILGKEGVACVELNKIKGYLTKAESTDSDPLVQRRKAGWKAMFKAVITNEDFVARGETYATNA